MLGADRGHRAGAHVGDAARVEDRLGRAGSRIEQHQNGQFGWKAELVIVDEVADHLDPRAVDRRPDRTAQHIEMTVGDPRFEMHARFDHGLAAPLAGQARLDSRQYFVVGNPEFFDVEAIEIGDVNRRQREPPRPTVRDGSTAIPWRYVYTLLRHPGK